jgi:hypothetical protein
MGRKHLPLVPHCAATTHGVPRGSASTSSKQSPELVLHFREPQSASLVHMPMQKPAARQASSGRVWHFVGESGPIAQDSMQIRMVALPVGKTHIPPAKAQSLVTAQGIVQRPLG